MKILFISIAWPSQGERNLYSDLIEEFIRWGHKVYVVGTYESAEKKVPILSEENNISVLRINSGKIRKTKYWRKAFSLLTLDRKLSRAIRRFYPNEKIDLVIASTPPITLSGLYKKLKKKYNAPFYLLLKDIWPQGSVDLRIFRKYSPPWLFFRYHEVRIYKTADYIGCMSPLSVKYILSHNQFIPGHKVEVCPNSISPQEEVDDFNSTDIREKYNIPKDACVFIFSGNLGIGHGLHFIAEAIHRLTDYHKAFFVIGGSGTHFEYLKKQKSNKGLKNLLLYNWLPKEDFDKIRAASDVGLIFLYKYTSPQFPSRLLSYLEYSKPVLCAITQNTDIGSIVENARCGKSVNHGDMNNFINAIEYLSEHDDVRKEMGRNGRKLLMEKYTVKHCYDIIINHFSGKEEVKHINA